MATGLSFPDSVKPEDNLEQHLLNARINERKEKEKSLSSLRLLFIGLILFVLGGLGLGYQQLQDPSFLADLPSNILSLLMPTLSDKDYAEVFKRGLQSIEDENWQQAQDEFNKIKNQAHPVQPIALMHLAKAQAELMQEGQAQSNLNKMARLVSSSQSLYALSKYQLAQSYLRSSQKEKAIEAFEMVIEASPNTDLALGSHYYLGQLNRQSPSLKLIHWQKYLEGTGKGTFSLDVAQSLLAENNLKTPQQQANAGLAFYEAKALDKAEPLLAKAPLALAWLNLAKTQQTLKKLPQARQTLIKGLPLAQNAQEADEAIDLLIKVDPNPKATFKTLITSNLPYSKDKLIWYLSQNTQGAEKQLYRDQLIKNYPQSDWAPSLSWEKIWQLNLKGENQNFIAACQKHIQTYPYTRSAPKALFWLAKTQLQLGQKEQAEATLQKLAKNYAGKYYAYRAEQLLSNNRTPWAMPKTDSINPNASQNNESASKNAWHASWIKTAYSTCKTLDAQSLQVFDGLARVEGWQDIDTLTRLISTCQSPKSIQALADYNKNQYYPAIKGLEAELFERYRNGETDIWATAPLQIRQALYPLAFSDEVLQNATKQKISPFLITAITRQESAYNVFALSSSKAMGLMQLLPSTAKEVAGWEHLSGFDPSQLMSASTNIQLGSRYLNHLLKLFAGNTMQSVGAYNGGPGAMRGWVNQWAKQDPDRFIELIPYDQTKDYIISVFEHYWAYKSLYGTN